MDNTKIEWTDATWNPIRGCSRVSEGCRNCYAETVANRFKGPDQPYEGLIARTGQWNGNITVVSHLMDQPLRWKRPRKIFVNSMSDLFHEAVTDAEIDKIFAVMALSMEHTFQVLTKRPQRMRDYLQEAAGRILDNVERFDRYNPGSIYAERQTIAAREIRSFYNWPLKNVWLGVSVEDQETADERIALLMETPAAIRWISAEPLLGPISIEHWPLQGKPGWPGLNWVVTGGESGKGARPMHPDWARSLRDQCGAAGVPFLFKQWGEWVPRGPSCLGYSSVDGVPRVRLTDAGEDGSGLESEGSAHCWMNRAGKKAAGRLLDGRLWDQYPEPRQ